jgi:hypothetical protein
METEMNCLFVGCKMWVIIDAKVKVEAWTGESWPAETWSEKRHNKLGEVHCTQNTKGRKIKVERSKQRNLRHRPIITGVFLQLMTPINKSVVGMKGWSEVVVNPTSYVRMGSGSRPVWGRYLFFLIIQ